LIAFCIALKTENCLFSWQYFRFISFFMRVCRHNR